MMENDSIYFRLLAVFTAVFVSVTSYGQNDAGKKQAPVEKDGKTLSLVRTDSLPEILQYYLNESTSKHFEDPKIPRFLIKDRTDSFVFGVGGGVDAKIFYDYDGDTGDKISFEKEDVSHDLDNDVIDFDLTATNISFKVLGKTKRGVIDAFINADFSGGGGNLKLKQAYVNVFGLRIGKTNTGFRDDESIDMVDEDAVLSNTARKVPQVSYSRKFKNGMRVQGGFEFPQSVSVTEYAKYDSLIGISSIKTLLPDFTANWYYSRERLHLYAGAAMRYENYYDYSNVFRGALCYAFQLSGNWSLVKTSRPTHKLFFQGIWTRGMADCCRNVRDQGASAVVVYDEPITNSRFYVPCLWGASAGYQAKFGLNTIGLSYSVVNVYTQNSTDLGTPYSWAHAAGINYLRKVFQYGVIGCEFVAGRKYDRDGNKYTNMRGYLYLRYDF